MFKEFDDVKKQLSELACVINSFKSEAVQLRLVELTFAEGRPKTEHREADPEGVKLGHARRRRSKRKLTAGNEGEEKTSKKARVSSGTGAVATLASVYQTDFFKKPRTIGDILEHCETNLARKIKANEISGKLGRMVRNGELKRTKNADGQYEYTRT